MIVRLDKQRQREARHQLLADVVYIICQEPLKTIKRERKTDLEPVEVFLSARQFCDTVLSLPDIEEGLGDEIDDLEEEATGENDAMLIMVTATAQLQAMSKKRIGVDIKRIIFDIFAHLDGNELLWPLIKQMTQKEEERWIEGKRIDLLNYELKEIELEEGGIQEKIRVVSEITDAALNLSNEEVRGVLVSLVSINKKYDHVFDEQISKLLDKLGITQSEVHNHFEKDSHCNVFNDKVTGQFTQ